MYRAFYRPADGNYREEFVDAQTLEELSSGAILVIKINEDGTRELISEKTNRSQKEEIFYGFALRQLEFKHDGGDSPEMQKVMRDHR